MKSHRMGTMDRQTMWQVPCQSHECATLDDTWDRKPHGFHVSMRWNLGNEGQGIWKAITFDPKLGLEHGEIH
jgi:hypothetical protein